MKKLILFLLSIFLINNTFSYTITNQSEFNLYEINSTITFLEDVKIQNYMYNGFELELIDIENTSLDYLIGTNFRFSQANTDFIFPDDVDENNLEDPKYLSGDTDTSSGGDTEVIIEDDESPQITLINLNNGDTIKEDSFTLYFDVNSPINEEFDIEILDFNNTIIKSYSNEITGSFFVNFENLENDTEYFYSIKVEDKQNNIISKTIWFKVDFSYEEIILESQIPIIEIISPEQNSKEKGEVLEVNETTQGRAKIIFYIEDDTLFNLKVKDLDNTIYFEKENQTTNNFYFYMDNLSQEKQYQFFIEAIDEDQNKVISKAINFEFDTLRDIEKNIEISSNEEGRKFSLPETLLKFLSLGDN